MLSSSEAEKEAAAVGGGRALANGGEERPVGCPDDDSDAEDDELAAWIERDEMLGGNSVSGVEQSAVEANPAYGEVGG